MLWLMVLSSLILVSLVSLVGVITVPWSDARFRKLIPLMVSFAVGALFGDAFIHLLPEAFDALPSITVSALTLLGIMLFFALEKFIRWRHCHMPISEGHPHPLATMNLVGDGMHNLLDGMIIGASYLVSVPVGVSTTAAVLLHEIPQEMGDFGVLIHAGLGVKKALFYNFMSALVAIAGGVIPLLIGPVAEIYASAMLPVGAGAFVYIAGSDLIPELSHECELRSSLPQFISVLCGIAVMFLLLLLE
jgi:zinc and cadmium transporter